MEDWNAIVGEGKDMFVGHYGFGYRNDRGEEHEEVIEMWTWQRMLKISWTEKMTNEEMLVRANETSSILKMIWHRKHRWLGHVLRHDDFLHDIIEGKVMGKATRGRG